MVKQLHVAVIGSGASGLAAVKASLRVNSYVDLIDPFIEISSESNSIEVTYENNLSTAQKSKFGSTLMYEYPQSLLKRSSQLNVPLSATFGGLTSVWGGNVWFPKPEELGLSKMQEKSYAKSKMRIINDLRLMGSSSTDESASQVITGLVPFSSRVERSLNRDSEIPSAAYFGSSLLAVDSALCIKCGLCLTGCPTDAIFNAQTEWTKFGKSQRLRQVTGFAISIENDNSVRVLNGSQEFRTKKYDKIYLACGAIATARLLQASGLIQDEIYLNDTQVFYLPIFNYRRSDKVTKFTLAQLFYRSSESKNGIHISIYETSSEIRERVKKKLGPISGIIPNIFWNRLMAGIGFLPSELSGRLRICSNEVTVEDNPKIRERIRKILKTEGKVLRRFRFFIFRGGLQVPNPGASYHVGTIQNAEGHRILGMNGELPQRNNVFVVDSGGLARIPVGPITVGVMINADRIVTETCF